MQGGLPQQALSNIALLAGQLSSVTGQGMRTLRSNRCHPSNAHVFMYALLFGPPAVSASGQYTFQYRRYTYLLVN